VRPNHGITEIKPVDTYFLQKKDLVH